MKLQFCGGVKKEHVSYSIEHVNQKMSNMKIPGNLKYTMISVESCPGLLDINNITLKKRLGVPSNLFFIGKTSCWPVQCTITSCWAISSVLSWREECHLQRLGNYFAAFPVFLKTFSVLSTKLLQPYLENWHECSLRFRYPLFLPFLLIKLIRYLIF